MRILEVGNLNWMSEEFAHIMMELGHDVDILLWSHTCRPVHDKRINVIDIRKGGNKLSMSWNLYSTLKKIRYDYDLFHCHYAFQSVIAADLLGLDYVAHVRGTDIRRTAKHGMYGSFVEKALKDSLAVWCSTPDLVRLAKGYNKKAAYIPNVIDLSVYKPRKAKKKRGLNIFMPCRQVWKHKRNDRAIKALALVVEKRKSARLHLVEWGEDVAKTKELVRQLGLEKNVTWHDVMDKKGLARMYNSSDVVWDDFGPLTTLSLIALQAMACGAPLITKRVKKDYYPEPPPLLEAGKIGEIAQKTLNIGKSRIRGQRAWISKYFSRSYTKERVREALKQLTGVF